MKHEVHVSGQVNVVHEDSEVLRRLDALQALTLKLGEQLMALGDQLTATQAAILTAIDGVATELQDLIGRLVPGDVVTQAHLDQANAILAKIQGLPAEPKA